MNLYRRISVRMWGDAKFCALSAPVPNAQTLWIYLLTGDCTTVIPGVVRAGEAAIAESLGWPLKAFREAFLEVSTKGMAKADWKARLVFLPKALSHNPPQSGNVVKAWRRAFEELPDCELKNEIERAIKAYLLPLSEAFRKGFDLALPEGMAYPETETDPETEDLPFANAHSKVCKKAVKGQIEDWFERVFVPAYPEYRRVQQKTALAQLKRMNPDESARATIIATLDEWKRSADWTGENGKYIPGMAKFLSDPKYRNATLSNGKPASTYQSADDYWRRVQAESDGSKP